MSGAGGGGGFGAPTGTCETLVIDTQLSSPKPDVVATIEVGELLGVRIETAGPTITVVVTKDGQIAGGLAVPLLQRLRQCIEDGTQYTARVTAKKDGLVRVRVSAIRL
ncbi:hypothetical protein [Trinickia dinghuensis]|uniref:Uncharacterized protein n=1 Tax=Trinickia dinghuensis TaxID=2291023 RepID=A0A3D8JZ44_9BURK|nr:hypothetical protein [Trinickia dinghuensis]RDU98289.1 hypothetical protein DWV00_13300 [Trinickia dinghuensis]